MTILKIVAGQMRLSADLAHNAKVAISLLKDAYSKGAKVLFLPEAADYISRDAAHSVSLASTTQELFISPIQSAIKEIYESAPSDLEFRGICVAVGVHEPASGENFGKKVQNNQLWISSAGDVVHRYQKIHLFDVNITNGPILQELKSVEPGKLIVPPFAISSVYPGFNVGLSICYDIRFPELSLKLRKLGASILTFPSAFTTKTGEAHWLELGRARAIDSQCFVVMAAQCGVHDVGTAEGSKPVKRISYGQSVIIGPWGEVLAKARRYDELGLDETDPSYHELVVADLDLTALEKIRRDMPVFTHRRYDIYEGEH